MLLVLLSSIVACSGQSTDHGHKARVRVTVSHCNALELTVQPGQNSIMEARHVARTLRLECGITRSHSTLVVRLADGEHSLDTVLELNERDSYTRWTGDPGAFVSSRESQPILVVGDAVNVSVDELVFVQPHLTDQTQIGRSVDLFICCDTPPDKWDEYMSALRIHKSNLTGVILALYEMSSEGELVDQGSYVAAAVNASAKIRGMGLRSTALIAMAPGGVRHAMYNETVRKAFIADALARAASANIQGFNLDAEFPNDTNYSDGAAFVLFLNEFADALHAAENRTLSVDVHGDGSTPFDFHVWGPQYKSSRVDKIVTMATYTDAQKNFDKYFAEAAYVLGSDKIQPGLEPNAVLTNTRTAAYITSKNVSSIAIWGPDPLIEQQFWDGMGYFLHYPSIA